MEHVGDTLNVTVERSAVGWLGSAVRANSKSGLPRSPTDLENCHRTCLVEFRVRVGIQPFTLDPAHLVHRIVSPDHAARTLGAVAFAPSIRVDGIDGIDAPLLSDLADLLAHGLDAYGGQLNGLFKRAAVRLVLSGLCERYGKNERRSDRGGQDRESGQSGHESFPFFHAVVANHRS